MVARNDKHALPTGGLSKAPTLMDCFLEALAKRGPRDRNLPVAISPSADPDLVDPSSADPSLVGPDLAGPDLAGQSAAGPTPADAKPSPAVGTQPDLFST